MEFLPKASHGMLAVFGSRRRKDHVHRGFAERTEGVYLIFAESFLVATAMHLMAAGRNSIESVWGADMSEGVVIGLWQHGDEAVVFLLLNIPADTADGLILVQLPIFHLM